MNASGAGHLDYSAGGGPGGQEAAATPLRVLCRPVHAGGGGVLPTAGALHRPGLWDLHHHPVPCQLHHAGLHRLARHGEKSIEHDVS